MSTATAAWDLDVLVGSLARAGWGPLHNEIRGARTVLKALADVLPHGSAHGTTTTEQLAVVADMSDRWTRHCLAILERVGVLRWRRGWRRVPGRFTLCKRTIAAWIRDARKANAERRATRRPTSRPTQPRRPAAPARGRRTPSAAFSLKPELAAGLTSLSEREVTAAAIGGPPVAPRRLGQDIERPKDAPNGATPPEDATPATPEQRQRHLDQIRAILRQRKNRTR